MRKKMVIIGAGSAMFTKGLVMDLINNPGRNKWHLVLVDTNHEVLDLITKLVKKMMEAKNADIMLSYSTDRCEVLLDADYVISTIGVGGRRAWEQDVFIPRKYGIYQPVGDTAMPGGISRAMRMVPAMVHIAEDIVRLCPNAHFFNYSNPMTVICRAVAKAIGFPLTGLCIGVQGSEWYIADFAGLEREKVSSYSIGLNHCTFMFDFLYEGKDAWPIVREKLHDLYKEAFDDKELDGVHSKRKNMIFERREPFAWSMFKNYQAYPAPGDRHIVEFYPELFPGGKYYGKTLGVDAYSFEATVANGDNIHKKSMDMGNSDEPLTEEFFHHISGEHEQLMEIINSIENDSRKVFSVNLPNHGAIANLPNDAVLEMPAVATAKGFCPLKIDHFPDVLAAMICKHWSIVELTTEAALKGDKALFEEAILLGGYINDRNQVRNMVDELIKAHANDLPQFE